MIYVSVFAIKLLGEQDGKGPDIEFLTAPGFMNTLGFTIYCYEGIGIVMPVMATTAEPLRFKEMLTYAYMTIIAFECSFALLCYMTWGSNMDEPFITEMLPSDNFAVILIKFLYSINIIFSFAIVIYPTNTALETLFCRCFKRNSNA